jgi:hypothetical protein
VPDEETFREIKEALMPLFFLFVSLEFFVMKISPAYEYDAQGYFVQVVTAQENEMEKGDWLMPPSSTLKAPTLDDNHWAQWNGSAWTKVAKPKAPADCVGVVISHTSETPHDIEYRRLMEDLAKDSETHRLQRGDDLSWYVEEISQEEIELREAEAELSNYDAGVNSFHDRLKSADMIADQSEREAAKDKIRAEYDAYLKGFE